MKDLKIRKSVEKLISTEYDRALALHGEFVDFNQAESVLRGEFHETEREFYQASSLIEGVTDCVYEHGFTEAKEFAEKLEERLICTIEEAIRAAAMCRKFLEVRKND